MITVADNSNALAYGGYELIDETCTPPRTFAIAMPKEYADRAAVAMNNYPALHAAVAALVQAKGRFHTNLNYDELVRVFCQLEKP